MEGKDGSKNLKAIEKPEERYKQALHPEEAGGTSISLPDLPKSDLYSIFSAVRGVQTNVVGLANVLKKKKNIITLRPVCHHIKQPGFKK